MLGLEPVAESLDFAQWFLQVMRGHIGELFQLTVAALEGFALDGELFGLFTAGGLIGLYGPSGEGKSFLALDWALSISAGVDWFERIVLPGQSLYVAAEGGRSIRKRVAAWLKHKNL